MRGRKEGGKVWDASWGSVRDGMKWLFPETPDLFFAVNGVTPLTAPSPDLIPHPSYFLPLFVPLWVIVQTVEWPGCRSVRVQVVSDPHGCC